MTSQPEHDILETAAPTDLAAIDESKLTEEDKLLLLKRREQDESLLPEGHDIYNTPHYLVMLRESLKRVVHSIYPDSTPEQLAEVEKSVCEPVFNMMNDVAYHTVALVSNALPAVRQDHILQPPTRYMLDYSLSAILGVVTGAAPGLVEEGYLKAIGEDLTTWNRTLENVEVPEEGIAVEFVHANRILKGKLCYFSYMSVDGSAQVMTDILTYWCQEYNGFVHTHSVVFWRPLSKETPVEVETIAQEAIDEQSTAEF